jgi:hypothetical protein
LLLEEQRGAVRGWEGERGQKKKKKTTEPKRKKLHSPFFKDLVLLSFVGDGEL